MCSISRFSRIIYFLLVVGSLPFAEEARQGISHSRLVDCLFGCRHVRARDPGGIVPSYKYCHDACLNKGKKGVERFGMSTLSNSAAQELISPLRRRVRKEIPHNPNCPRATGQFHWSPAHVNATLDKYEGSCDWYINVTWTPLDDPSGKWKNILVRLLVGEPTAIVQSLNCTILPKNSTFLIIDKSSYGWKYPEPISINVEGFPFSRDSSPLKRFEPIVASNPVRDPRSGCPESYGVFDWSPAEVNETFHQYENSSEWYINVTWTPLTDDSCGKWTNVLVRLIAGLNNNGVKCFVLSKNSTFFIINQTSHGWKYPELAFVGVLALPFAAGISDMKTIKPPGWREHILTSSTAIPRDTTNSTEIPSDATISTAILRNATNSTNSTEIPPDATISTASILYGHATKGHKRTEIDAAIIVGSLLGLALVVLLVSYLCRSKETKPIPPGFEYHAFIIYSCEDKSWVTSILLPFLEEKHRLKCCIHYRDFIPGIPFRENMANAVYKSYKTIAVFSHNFLGSTFSIDELDMAVYRLLEKRDRSVVVVRIDDAALRELPRALCKRSVIDYSSSLEIHFWKSKLLEFLAVQDDSSSPSTSSGSDSTIRNTMVELNNNNRSRSSSTGSRSVVTLGEGGSVEVLV